MVRIIIALLGALAVFFVVAWLINSVILARMTPIERAQLALEEAQEETTKIPIKTRLSNRLVLAGYSGDLAPIIVGYSGSYLALLILAKLAGINILIAAIISPFISLLILSAYLSSRAQAQRDKFNLQLLDALKSINARLIVGETFLQALRTSLPGMEDPLHTELSSGLNTMVGTERDIIDVLKDIEVRYPSKALKLLIVALSINSDAGTTELAPAVSKLIVVLTRKFDLEKESKAELAQARSTLYLVVLGLAGLVFSLTFVNHQTVSSFTSGAGIIVGGVGLGWFTLWVIVIQKMIKKLKNDYF